MCVCAHDVCVLLCIALYLGVCARMVCWYVCVSGCVFVWVWVCKCASVYLGVHSDVRSVFHGLPRNGNAVLMLVATMCHS
jgi:hypothetical protein